MQDELRMRNFLTEGDLVSVRHLSPAAGSAIMGLLTVYVCACVQAEVQQVFNDGSLSLHTRSLKYGKVSMFVGWRFLSLVVTCCSKSSLVDDCIFSGISCCRERWCVFLLLW